MNEKQLLNCLLIVLPGTVSSAACQVITNEQMNLEEKVSKINGLFRVSSGLSWDRQTDFLSTELFDQVRSTLFNVEGLKVEENEDTILLALSTLWLAMAKHLGLNSEDLIGLVWTRDSFCLAVGYLTNLNA